ncbi:MAG: hypothetical protein M3P51_03710 [Chloroflexota bacterium]|nr:hypothetical protein [Chloroflexota bacterium]
MVSLGAGTPPWSSTPWRDFVTKHDVYWHPHDRPGSGWPREPPELLGFRWAGRLQQIRTVETVEVVLNLGDVLPELVHAEQFPRRVYHLGELIRLAHEVPTGRLWPSGRVWTDLDLLLTAHSVAEARDRTKERAARRGAYG